MIFSHNPVGQEEKQGKARFPLAVLFDCRAIDEHPPLRYGERVLLHRIRGTGRAGQSTKKEPIPQTKKTHTPKRHNRLHQDKTKNCNAHYRIKKNASNLVTK